MSRRDADYEQDLTAPAAVSQVTGETTRELGLHDGGLSRYIVNLKVRDLVSLSISRCCFRAIQTAWSTQRPLTSTAQRSEVAIVYSSDR